MQCLHELCEYSLTALCGGCGKKPEPHPDTGLLPGCAPHEARRLTAARHCRWQDALGAGAFMCRDCFARDGVGLGPARAASGSRAAWIARSRIHIGHVGRGHAPLHDSWLYQPRGRRARRTWHAPVAPEQAKNRLRELTGRGGRLALASYLSRFHAERGQLQAAESLGAEKGRCYGTLPQR